MYYTFMLYPALQQPVVVTDESVLESRWHQPWVDPIGRTFQAQRQRLQIAQTATGVRFDPFPIPFVSVGVDSYYPPFAEPRRFKKGLGAHLQSTTVVDPTALTQAEQVDESKWHQPWSEPANTRLKLRKGLATPSQPFFAFQPLPVPPLTNIGWFASLSEPKRFKKGLRHDLQMHATTGAHAIGNPYSRAYIIT